MMNNEKMLLGNGIVLGLFANEAEEYDLMEDYLETFHLDCAIFQTVSNTKSKVETISLSDVLYEACNAHVNIAQKNFRRGLMSEAGLNEAVRSIRLEYLKKMQDHDCHDAILKMAMEMAWCSEMV